MSAISTILTRLANTVALIRSAIYAIDVRDDIADAIEKCGEAIEQCYSDVSNPTLQTEALEAALQEKIDQGEMAALTIGDRTITAVKLANGVIPAADATLTTSGGYADAAETGRQIGNIKADLDAQVADINESLGVIIGGGTEQREIQFVYGSYINDGNAAEIGETVDLANLTVWYSLKHAIVECQEGDEFLIDMAGATNARAWAFLTSNNVLLSRSNENETVTGKITAPQNAGKVIIQGIYRQTPRDTSTDEGTAYKLIQGAGKVVRFDVAQDKTEEEKARARANIGIDSLEGTYISYDYEQGLTDEQQIQAQKNIGLIDAIIDQIGTYNWAKNYITTNGDPVDFIPASDPTYPWRHTIIDCVEGDTFLVNVVGGSRGRAWAFVDSNNNRLTVADEVVTVTDKKLTAPIGAVKFVVNDMNGRGYVYKIGNGLSDWVDNAYISVMTQTNAVNITPVSNNQWRYQRKRCAEGDRFIVNLSGGNVPRGWAFTDSSNKRLTFATQLLTAKNVLIVAPKGTAWLIINDNKSDGLCYKITDNIAAKMYDLTAKMYDLTIAKSNFAENITVEYCRDDTTGTSYFVTRIFQTKLDGTKQYPFTRFPTNDAQYTAKDLKQVEGWDIIINAGWYALQIENGVAISCTPESKPTRLGLTINKNGQLGYLSSWTAEDADTIINSGVISATSMFFPLVVDYEAFKYPDDATFYTPAQRQIIGQYGNGDYAIITCEGRNFNNSRGWTVPEAQNMCLKLGLKFAFNLDGGGSTQTVIGKKQLTQIYDSPNGRLLHGFIVFNGSDHFYIPDP